MHWANARADHFRSVKSILVEGCKHTQNLFVSPLLEKQEPRASFRVKGLFCALGKWGDLLVTQLCNLRLPYVPLAKKLAAPHTHLSDKPCQLQFTAAWFNAKLTNNL